MGLLTATVGDGFLFPFTVRILDAALLIHIDTGKSVPEEVHLKGQPWLPSPGQTEVLQGRQRAALKRTLPHV